MSRPLIILGAGASFDFQRIDRYDSSDQNTLGRWRPPLTNNIFDVSRFSEIIGKYEDVKDLASEVINIVDGTEPFDFEEYLTEIEKKYPEQGYPQIVALRFYLAELFSKVSHYFYRHTNNHRHLLNQLRYRGGKATFINFNYDTLLEKNIKRINLSNNLESYINGDIRVIKIHGAYNWRYDPKPESQEHDVYDYFVSKINDIREAYKDVGINKNFVKNFDYSDDQKFQLSEYKEHVRGTFPMGAWHYYLPAVAIPIGSKGDFVCPKSHIDTLIKDLDDTDRILIIGWRAQDDYLVKLLNKKLKHDIKLEIVSSNKDNAEKISKKFDQISQINKPILMGDYSGYTDFMIKRGYESFLS